MDKVAGLTRPGGSDEPDSEADVDEYDDYDRMACRLPYEAFADLDDRADWERELPEARSLEQQLDLEMPAWEVQEREAAEAQRQARLCTKCGERRIANNGLCTDCWRDTGRLCAICNAKPRVAGHRCDTCRKYFERTGRERPARLASRQPELNQRFADRPGHLVGDIRSEAEVYRDDAEADRLRVFAEEQRFRHKGLEAIDIEDLDQPSMRPPF